MTLSIDVSQPDIPFDIYNLAADDADLTYSMRCEELWDSVLNEALDQVHMARSHANVGTYDKGCRGPLCTKANREHPRRARNEVPKYLIREERIFDPVLDYFYLVIKYRIRIARSNLLKELNA